MTHLSMRPPLFRHALAVLLAALPIAASAADTPCASTVTAQPTTKAPASVGSQNSIVPYRPNPAVQNELEPDRTCRRPEESSDVWGKVANYGGIEAQARMQQLLASNFKYSDLTPPDKELLRYLAYTTIWIPSPIETALGKLYSQYLSSGVSESEGSKLDKAALARLQVELDRFRETIPNFPLEPALVLDAKNTVGASARPGGFIAINKDFLARMDDKQSVRRLIIAHELSHLYKRHTIKELQYQLITSSGGFQIAKKLLGRFNPNTNTNLFDRAKEAFGLATAASDLYGFVKENQLAFQVNQEFEADACSVEWMTRAGYDPKELWQAFADLKAVPGDEQTSYACTHPTTEQRQQNINNATQVKSGSKAGVSKDAGPAPKSRGKK